MSFLETLGLSDTSCREQLGRLRSPAWQLSRTIEKPPDHLWHTQSLQIEYAQIILRFAIALFSRSPYPSAGSLIIPWNVDAKIVFPA